MRLSYECREETSVSTLTPAFFCLRRCLITAVKLFKIKKCSVQPEGAEGEDPQNGACKLCAAAGGGFRELLICFRAKTFHKKQFNSC